MLTALANAGIRLGGKTSGSIKTVCPKCSPERKNSKDPCLSVDIDEGIWNCHHCGWKGTTKVKSISNRRDYTLPEPSKSLLGKKWLDWFKDRKITEASLTRYRITESLEYSPAAKANVPCINFNYYRDSKLVNIKYRGEGKRFKMVKDAELIFYGMDECKGDNVVICEGEIDVLAMYEAGIYTAVSVPNGAVNGVNKLEYLDNTWQFFEGKERIYLATDNDAPGRMLMEALAQRLGKDRCYIVDFPDGCKDANDVLMFHGKEILHACYKQARIYPLDGIKDLVAIEEGLDRLYRNGSVSGAKIGFNEFDQHITWKRGEFTVVTGVPGCFSWNQMVITKDGQKPISQITSADSVLSYNHDYGENEYRRVINRPTHYQTPDRLIEITMKDGTVIKVTENHEFYDGEKYVKIKDLLKL